MVAYHGGREAQELSYKYELFPDGTDKMKAHVVIMSYDSAQDPKTHSLFNQVSWMGLVVDEGQRLKNDQNLLYLALRRMKIPFRLLLTGTPLQNNKRELFNLIQFIDSSQSASALDLEYSVLNKETLPKLHEKIRPYFLRRTKAAVLKFLPSMSRIILPVTLTVVQEKLSKSIMAKNPQLIKAMYANSKLGKKDRGSLNNIMVQLRKCLCHPFIYSDAIEEKHHDQSVVFRNLIEASGKLVLLRLMLPKLKENGHRVLIFSQFLAQLDIMEDFLNGLGYQFRRLDGSMSSLQKQQRIDAFNEPGSELFVFLLSTRAGGVGINLATADTVIIMDPDFNPHQDMQALSRAHRIGQKKDVICFQMVTKDSVEEKIMQVGRKKMALDHALIESMDDHELEGDDLESILKHGAQALFSDDYQKSAIVYDEASVNKLLDRSKDEQAKAGENGDANFSHAQVWVNDKAQLEDSDGVEKSAPEPINSSVWDEIIAQREAEARQEAEAHKEMLGRGGRRRQVSVSNLGQYQEEDAWLMDVNELQAINYKTNVAGNTGLPEDVAESSEDTDDFNGAGSEEDSDDEQAPTESKRRKVSHIQHHTPTATPTKSKGNKINSKFQQRQTSERSRPTYPPTPDSQSKPKPASKAFAKSSTPRRQPKSSQLKSSQLEEVDHQKPNQQLPTPDNSVKKRKVVKPHPIDLTQE